MTYDSPRCFSLTKDQNTNFQSSFSKGEHKAAGLHALPFAPKDHLHVLHHLLTSRMCSECRAEQGFGSSNHASSILDQPALHKTVFTSCLHYLLSLLCLCWFKWNKGCWVFFKLKLKNLHNLYDDKMNLVICPILQRLKLVSVSRSELTGTLPGNLYTYEVNGAATAFEKQPHKIWLWNRI